MVIGIDIFLIKEINAVIEAERECCKYVHQQPKACQLLIIYFYCIQAGLDIAMLHICFNIHQLKQIS